MLALDPLDSKIEQFELIGLTAKSNTSSQRFRVEFFDLDLDHGPEVILELDLWPDPGLQPRAAGDWDLRLVCSPGRPPVLTSFLPESESIATPAIVWDDARDFLEVTFPQLQPLRSAPFLIRVEARDPGTHDIADILGPVPSDSRETRTGDLLLVFWNSFSATTPADAWRSWDGAHSGPAGERFGLRYLLEAVDEFEIPIAVLDLTSPTSLAGLEYLGHLSRVQHLHDQGLLSLPQSLPVSYVPTPQTRMLTEQILSARRSVSSAYGLHLSPWISILDPYLSDEVAGSLPHSGLRGMIAGPAPNTSPLSSTRLTHINGFQLLPLPRTDTARSDGHAAGLSLEWRKALLQAALEDEPGTLIMLGGSFKDTFWGDPSIVEDNFDWLAAHPWIRVVNLEDLLHGAAPAYTLTLAQDYEIRHAPSFNEQSGSYQPGQNPIIDMALDLQARILANQDCLAMDHAGSDDFWTRCDPDLEAKRDRLRQLANPTLSMLSFAGEWAQSSACSGLTPSNQTRLLDIDNDGKQEAILATDRLLAIIDPQGGRLSGLFGCKPGLTPTTFVSPRAMAAIGLSDPRDWSFQGGEIGEWAEPLLDGGFVFPTDAGMMFDLEITEDGIQATQPLLHYQVQYTLIHDALHVTMVGSSNGERLIEVPFAVAPERLLHPGFMLDYQLVRGSDGFILGPVSGLQLDVTVAASKWKVDSFLDSPASSLISEEPNLEAPQGHYLPLPFTLLRFALDDFAQDSVVIRIR